MRLIVVTQTIGAGKQEIENVIVPSSIKRILPHERGTTICFNDGTDIDVTDSFEEVKSILAHLPEPGESNDKEHRT